MGAGTRAALLVLLVLAAAAALAARRPRVGDAAPLRAGFDGEAYRVQPGLRGAPEAADRLAELNDLALGLLAALRRRYSGLGGERAAAAAALRRRYNPDNLAENPPTGPRGDTAYSLNKGALLAVCLRAKPSGELHPFPLLAFVYLHELAHLALEEYDHPPRFWAAFRWLLEEAEAAGLYASPDFARAPAVYCGVRVDYNPRYDPGVAPLGDPGRN